VLGAGADVQYVDAWMLLYPWYVAQQRAAHPAFAYEHRPGHVDSLALIAQTLRDGRPVYLANPYSDAVARWPGYPVGPLRRLVAPGQPLPSPAEVIALNEALYPYFLRRGRTPDPQRDPWSASLREPFARTWLVLSDLQQRAGDARAAADLRARARDWAPWLLSPSQAPDVPRHDD
jgi:hypothetical protein